MPFTTAGINLMLDALIGTNPTTPITHAGLHDGEPGDSGLNEISGGSPAYARQSISFSAAASKAIDSSNQPVFDVPAAATVSYVAFWSALTSGSCLAYADVTDEVFGSQGSYTLTDADLSIS